MMENRRGFTKKIITAGVAATTLPFLTDAAQKYSVPVPESNPQNLKLSLNAFSFDKPLRAGTMTIDDLLDFCAKTGFDGADLTGYYFPGYPEVPTDEYLFHVKQKAFRLGIELGCTGVRNDFTWHDPAKRESEKKLVRDWIIAAQKLGAPGLRIFAGTLSKENFSWEERAKWIAGDIRECAEFGKQHGVMLALQNHNDFLKNSAQVETLLNLIDSDWVGLMLDIGSYHTDDPYVDIAANSKYAITWQMKEKVFVRDSQVETDFIKIRDIVSRCGYRGYLPLETLGEGDPYQKVSELFKKVSSVLKG
ncbi:MAG TPA: sugar phosphate isomerase/epimerase family protein [Bacteroidales bacterium]|nr:sugar phosphate isomerase/epimerase family protein [Bacteroidales bacterium]